MRIIDNLAYFYSKNDFNKSNNIYQAYIRELERNHIFKEQLDKLEEINFEKDKEIQRIM